MIGNPCSDNCSCAKPFMSGGCDCCSKFGSNAQQKAKSEYLKEKERMMAVIPSKRKSGMFSVSVVNASELFDQISPDLWEFIQDNNDLTFGDANFTLVTPERMREMVQDAMEFIDFDKITEDGNKVLMRINQFSGDYYINMEN